jgi:hypothetical protein
VQFDAEMAQRADAAAAEGGVLRYVGVVDVASGTASVTLQRWGLELRIVLTRARVFPTGFENPEA